MAERSKFTALPRRSEALLWTTMLTVPWSEDGASAAPDILNLGRHYEDQPSISLPPPSHTTLHILEVSIFLQPTVNAGEETETTQLHNCPLPEQYLIHWHDVERVHSAIQSHFYKRAGNIRKWLGKWEFSTSAVAPSLARLLLTVSAFEHARSVFFSNL